MDKETKPKAKARPKKKAAPKKPKAKMGRPTDYTVEIADAVCDGIAIGKSLKTVCSPSSMPNPRSIYRWIREYPDFSRNYEFAKEDQADAMVEEMRDTSLSADSDNVQVARLQIDVMKWTASKFKQKRYGDKLQTDNVNVNIEYAELSDDELDRKLSRLES